MMVETIETGSH